MKRIALTLIASSFAAAPSFAGTVPNVPPAIQMTGTDGDSEWSLNLITNDWTDETTGDYTWGTKWPGASSPTFNVANPDEGSTPLIWGNLDPVLNVNFSVQNATTSTQNYTFRFTIPITPAIGPTSITGGSTTLGITDGNGDGVTAGDAAKEDAFYTALIDGATHVSLDLLDTGLSNDNAFESAATDGDFGTPIPSHVGPAVNDTIGIEYKFTLSAGDTAAITGNFVVVPEPGTIALMGTGAFLIARRRR